MTRLSPEVIVTLIGVIIAAPASLYFIWTCLRRRRLRIHRHNVLPRQNHYHQHDHPFPTHAQDRQPCRYMIGTHIQFFIEGDADGLRNQKDTKDSGSRIQPFDDHENVVPYYSMGTSSGQGYISGSTLQPNE